MAYNLRPRSRGGFPSASVAALGEAESQAPDEVTVSEALEILATEATAEIESHVTSELANTHITHLTYRFKFYICTLR